MAQGNVEWYSVHTNRVALRKMAQRNDRFTTVSTRRCFNCKHYFRHTMQIKAFRYHFDWKMSKLIFLICFDIFQSKWHRNALIANTIFGTPINALWYHFDWKMSKQTKDISFLTMASNSAHKGTHKIQLLTYSCNVERTAEFKLSLKSKRESEKRRELDKRHLMHVIIIRNTINIQANRSVQTVVNREAGKPW